MSWVQLALVLAQLDAPTAAQRVLPPFRAMRLLWRDVLLNVLVISPARAPDSRRV